MRSFYVRLKSEMPLTLIIIMSLTLLTFCGGKKETGGKSTKSTVSNGDKVSVHYKGTFPDGKVFDKSHGRGPLRFTVGAGQMIKGFDKAVVGMKIGETKTVTLPPEEAYGPLALPPYPRKNLRKDLKKISKPGKFETKNYYGKKQILEVLAVDEKTVTLRNPHPMAGKTLIFEIKILSID